MQDCSIQVRKIISAIQRAPREGSRLQLALDTMAQVLEADVVFFGINAEAAATALGWHKGEEGLSSTQISSLRSQVPSANMVGVEQNHVLQCSLDGWGLEPLEILYLPMMVHSERLGGVFAVRSLPRAFEQEEIMVAELSVLLAGMEWVTQSQAQVSAQRRMEEMARQAIGTLSYSELQAVDVILNELGGNEGVLVASRIADREQITRSVIVNALRKVESAGLIETRSLGMKGTYIRIINDKLIEELKYL